MKQPIKTEVIKTCGCCNKQYAHIPDNAKRDTASILPGWYWNCDCGSTLVVPLVQLKAALTILMTFMLAACGGNGGGNSPAPADPNQVTCATLQGTYSNDMSPGDTLTVSGSCTFTDSICGYTASYSVPDRVSGATTVTVQGTNGTPGCMSSTAHACVMEYNGFQLGVNCDAGAHIYLFTKQ